MTFSQLQKALEQMGVKEIAEVGVEFDPNLHNAIKQMDDTDFEENKVCQIYQKRLPAGRSADSSGNGCSFCIETSCRVQSGRIHYRAAGSNRFRTTR